MGNYVEVSDLTAEGVSGSPALLSSRIAKWEALVEAYTQQVFREISPGELVFDGNDSKLLHFSLPLVSVSSVVINDTVTLASTQYRAHIGRQVPKDDRKNPKLELLSNRSRSVFVTPSAGIFIKGMDQKITATWGYLDENGNCPEPVKQAIIEIVCLDLDNYFDKGQDQDGIVITPMRRERTDGHEIEYQQTEQLKVLFSHLPGHIQSILAMYRKPLQIAVPGNVNKSTSVIYGW